MVAAGVRLALQGAASVAGLLITTEAMVAERPERKAAQVMPGGEGMEWDGWHGRHGFLRLPAVQVH